MRTSTLLLVCPNKLSHVGLKSLFKESPFAVIGEVCDIAKIDLGALAEPDIALVECPNDFKEILDVLDRLHEIFPDTPVVILNDKVDVAILAACLVAGARAFLTKDISRDALLGSMQLAVLGETVLPTYLAGLLVDGVLDGNLWRVPVDDACELSDREIEIVECLLRGESNKLIARRLGITEATIKVHMKNVMRKIKANNRTQAAIWAHNHGYLPAGDATRVNEGLGRINPN